MNNATNEKANEEKTSYSKFIILADGLRELEKTKLKPLDPSEIKAHELREEFHCCRLELYLGLYDKDIDMVKNAYESMQKTYGRKFGEQEAGLRIKDDLSILYADVKSKGRYIRTGQLRDIGITVDDVNLSR